MKKTAFQELVDIIESAKNIDDVKKLITDDMFQKDIEQIIDAFEAGNSYGSSILPTFDYPANRYYYYTYRNPNENK